MVPREDKHKICIKSNLKLSFSQITTMEKDLTVQTLHTLVNMLDTLFFVFAVNKTIGVNLMTWKYKCLGFCTV